MAWLSSPFIKAQKLKIDKVALIEGDNSAVDNPHYDTNKNPCAMLKVYINDMPDLKFEGSYVMDKNNIKYTGGYYAVYVPAKAPKVEVRHSEFAPVTINFKDDFGIVIKGGNTYRVDLSTEGMPRTVVFKMPQGKGKIVVDNQSHDVDNGGLQLELLPGEHTYTATAEYYRDSTGCFTVADKSDNQVVTLNLKPCMANVNFICNVPAAKLYVDSENKGLPGQKRLPMGKHRIRVVAKDCIDHTDNVLIDNESGFELNVRMQPKSVISVVIEAEGFTSPSLYINNRLVPSWENGKEIKVERGTQLISVEGKEGSREKKVNIQLNMGVITISR